MSKINDYKNFDAFVKSEGGTLKIAAKTGLSKHVISHLRNDKNLLDKHVATFVKLKESYPGIDLFHYFPALQKLKGVKLK